MTRWRCDDEYCAATEIDIENLNRVRGSERVCVCVSGGREKYRGRKYETRNAWKKQASLSAKRFDSLWINVTVQDCGTIASKIPADSIENRRKPKAPVFSPPRIVSIVQHGSHDSVVSFFLLSRLPSRSSAAILPSEARSMRVAYIRPCDRCLARARTHAHSRRNRKSSSSLLLPDPRAWGRAATRAP